MAQRAGGGLAAYCAQALTYRDSGGDRETEALARAGCTSGQPPAPTPVLSYDYAVETSILTEVSSGTNETRYCNVFRVW